MRRWLSLAALLAALTCAAPAAADTPAQVYSDFAEDNVLSCGHSRGALKGVLSDASLQQYGDPYTYLGLKLAVRKQLARGCRRTTQAAAPRPSAIDDGHQDGDGHAADASGEPDSAGESREQSDDSAAGSDAIAPANGALRDVGDTQDGRLTLVGIGLLLATLACGGWAAKRAYSDRG